MRNLFSKLMMVLLIALFALPAQAKFYATGNDNYATATGGTLWGDSPNAFELNEVSADSHYTLTMNVTDALVGQNIILRLSTSNSTTWDTSDGDVSGFNNNAWGIDSGTTNPVVENTTHPIKKHGTDGTNLQFTPSSAGTYILDITDVNMTEGTANVKVYKEQAFPETLYIGLEITTSGWTFGTPMESKGNGVYEYTFTNDNKNPFYFLISASSSTTCSWGDDDYANFYGPASGDYEITNDNGRMNVAQTVTKGKGNVFKMTNDGTYKVTVSLTDANNGTVTVSPVQETSSDTYQLKTSENNWETYYDFTDNGDGTYTYTMSSPASGLQFMVRKNGADHFWPTSAVTYSGGNQTIPLGTTSGNNITMGADLSGSYTITLDPTVPSLTISDGSTPTTNTYSIRGTIKDGDTDWTDYAMTENNGVWEWTATVKAGNFGIKELNSDGSQVNWIWSSDKATISAAGEYTAVIQKDDNGANWSSTLAGEYKFSFDPSTMKITISGASTPTPSAYYRVKYSKDNWSTTEFQTMSDDDADGVYTTTFADPVAGLELMVQSSSDGITYKDFCWPSSDDKSYTGGDKTFTMSGAYGSNVTFGAGLTDTYTLELTPNTTTPTASTLKISGNEVVVITYDDVYLTGSFNSWSTSDANYKFTTTDGKIYTLTGVTLDSGVTMKVRKKDTNYGYDNATVESEVSQEESDGYGGQNIKLTQDLSDATITVDFSGEKPVITILNPKSVYLRGDFTSTAWTDDAAYKFSTTDGKIYTLSGVNIASGKLMKIYYNSTYYGYDENKVSKPLKSDGSQYINMQLYADLIDATLTFDITDAENWKLTVDNNKDAYLRGDFTDPTWSNNDAYKFSTTDNETYVLEHVNLDSGKLLKVYYGGLYYGHNADRVTGPVNSADDGQGGYNMQLSEQLKDATITFTMPTPYDESWTLTIVNGAEVEHKAYYFAGDMNRWYSKKFEGDESASGIDGTIFAAEKGNWQFEYVGEVEGQSEKGWYKYVFDKNKVGMSTLVGQFQIIDDSGWSGSQYSNNPATSGYSDASGFARYICRPITRDMISNGTVMTKETSEGMPGIIQQAGSNFHLDCNGVNNAVIYFLPGSDPKMIVKGDPTDYFIFYSADGKSGGDGAVSIKIVNDKPNTTNYYLPGVEGLQNYTSEDASTTAEHMNIAAVTPTLIDFSESNFDSDTAFTKVFENSVYVGDLTLEEFVNKIKTDSQLPNGISLTDRGQVYVIKIPNGFEYAAGTKFAVTFEKAFADAEKTTATSIVANHLYFFNDNLHVMLNVDNYEAGAKTENAYVKLYYRVYGYDSDYNTIVVDKDGTTYTLYDKDDPIGLTADGDDTQKNTGWVEYNEYGDMSLILSTAKVGENWHYATNTSRQIYGIDPKYGNFFVQFKVVTGPNASAAPANGPAKVVDKEYTLYLPDKTLALNQEGYYNFNGKDLYVALDGGYTTTGVEVIVDAEAGDGVDAEPIFFNLQGQRVVNPEKGLYIVVKGNKTYKVMIK